MAQPLSPRVTGPVANHPVAQAVVPHDRVEAAYRQHSAKMWRTLLAYSGDPDVASDALAEAFAQALRRETAIRHVERWVWRAAFRIAAGELQTASSHPHPRSIRPFDDPDPTFNLVMP